MWKQLIEVNMYECKTERHFFKIKMNVSKKKRFKHPGVVWKQLKKELYLSFVLQCTLKRN